MRRDLAVQRILQFGKQHRECGPKAKPIGGRLAGVGGVIPILVAQPGQLVADLRLVVRSLLILRCGLLHSFDRNAVVRVRSSQGTLSGRFFLCEVIGLQRLSTGFAGRCAVECVEFPGRGASLGKD